MWLRIPALWLASGIAALAGVHPTPDGVRVESGRAGYTLAYPQFLAATGEHGVKPLEVVVQGTHAHLAYQDGASVDVDVAASGEITLQPQKLPPAWTRLKLECLLGFGLAESGTFAVDEGAAHPFPAAKPEKPMLHQGPAGSLTLTTAGGDACTFKLPPFTYLQLQDNRAWGWKMFSCFAVVPFDVRGGPVRLQVTTGRDAATAAAAPVVRMDALGQFAGSDWPLKARSIDDLKADVPSEEAYYASFERPALDPYGGLPGSGERLGLKKTGFFHVEQKGAKWSLVDPAGNLFFHLGVCSFQPYQSDTYVAKREELYAWLPPHDGPFATAWGDGHGRTREEFNFHLANMIRKYGAPYDPTAYAERMIARVRAFGFNSAGAFGDPDKAAREKQSFPYVSSLPLYPWSHGIKTIEREVWDPFDDGNRASVAEHFATLAAKAGDPLLIGYFIANEPLYENLPGKIPTLKGSWACKRALVGMLREKYTSAAAFQAAWGVEARTFDELNDRALPVKTHAASEDMQAYMALFYETLYTLVCDTARRYDPNHLILGNRFQYGTINNEALCRIAGRHVDIMSFNYYTYGIDRAFLDRIHAWTGGRPMILSEFYWDSPPDSGLPGGVKDVNSQQERGLAYRTYVETAASMGYIVGAEWFTLLDTSYTGVGFEKGGGWNANEGLFSVVDRPWKPAVELMARSNREIYQVVLGERAPFAWDDPRFRTGGGGTRTAKASRTARPMVLDGRSDEWPGVPADPIGADRVVEGNAGDGVQGAFKLCWDATNLYVLVDVVDPTPMQNAHAGEGIWNGDAIELFVGSEEPEQGGALLFTDRQVLMSTGQPAGTPPFFVRNAPAQPAALPFVVAPRADGKGYVLEAAIPWQVLAVSPAEGRDLRFDLAIDDGAGPRRLRQLMWNGTTRNAAARDGWGRLQLVP